MIALIGMIRTGVWSELDLYNESSCVLRTIQTDFHCLTPETVLRSLRLPWRTRRDGMCECCGCDTCFGVDFEMGEIGATPASDRWDTPRLKAGRDVLDTSSGIGVSGDG